MNEKVCFVIMGFGKKMDYYNAKEVDLDKIYLKIVKPLFQEKFSKYKLIRADEISGSSIIDVSMYALLINADLVIADLTTLNANAIYELGVRHAVRPFSTIIMAQSDCDIPFDLGHSRRLVYPEIGEKLDEYKVNNIKEELEKFIIATEKDEIDSPLYTFLPKIIPPKLSDEEYQMIVDKAESCSDTVSKLVEHAEEYMSKSKFTDAIHYWKKLKTALPKNEYIVQQLALATYKSKSPNKTMALQKALEIILVLDPEHSLDLETLGISGAIFKNLFRINNNYDYLEKATQLYKKGYIIKKDYYNGENYANCLLLKLKKADIDLETITYLKMEIGTVYKDVIEIIEKNIESSEINFWMYATLSTAYNYLGLEDQFKNYKELFFENVEAEWQKDTFLKTISEMDQIIKE